jgi:hypothetical protein
VFFLMELAIDGAEHIHCSKQVGKAKFPRKPPLPKILSSPLGRPIFPKTLIQRQK